MVLAKQLVLFAVLFIASFARAEMPGLDLVTFAELDSRAAQIWTNMKTQAGSEKEAFTRLLEAPKEAKAVRELAREFSDFMGTSELDFFKAISLGDPRKDKMGQQQISPLSRLILMSIAITTSAELVKVAQRGFVPNVKKVYTDLLWCVSMTCPSDAKKFSAADLSLARRYVTVLFFASLGGSGSEFCATLVDSNYYLNLSRLLLTYALHENDLFMMNGYAPAYGGLIRQCAMNDYENNYGHLYKIPDAQLLKTLKEFSGL